MKKLFGVISCAILLSLSVLGLTACGECKHEQTAWNTLYSATCENVGVEQNVCVDCNLVLDSRQLEKTAHTPSEWIIDEQATCEENGLQHKECTACEVLLESQTIELKGHTPSDWIIDEQATCEKNGLQHKECTVCETLLDSEIIALKNHVSSDWIVDIPNGYMQQGSSHKVCSECDAILEITKTEAIAEIVLEAQSIDRSKGQTLNIDLSNDQYIVQRNLTLTEQTVLMVSVEIETSTAFEVEFTITNNVISINVKDLPRGQYVVSLLVDGGEFGLAYGLLVEVEDTTYYIGTATELNEFLTEVTNTKRGEKSWTVELTDNIDYGNATTFNTRNYTLGNEYGYFSGVFNGNGYTISNVNVTGNAMIWGVQDATIKNVAFVNINRTTSAAGSVLVWNSYGANVIENVYVQATYKNDNISTVGGLVCEGKDFTLNNVIVNIEFTTANKSTAINYWEGCFAGDNVYVISSTAKAFCTCETHQGNVGMYASKRLLWENISEESLNTFSADFWNTTTAGRVEWKNL